jgi:hypothetical protein
LISAEMAESVLVPGMHGIRAFAASINPPHATVLAVGSVRRQPVGRPDGGVAFVGQMTVLLSCDHRVVDGALGAEFLAAFRGFIENSVTALASGPGAEGGRPSPLTFCGGCSSMPARTAGSQSAGACVAAMATSIRPSAGYGVT